MNNEEFRAEWEDAYKRAMDITVKFNDAFIKTYKGEMTEELLQLQKEERQARKSLEEAEAKYFNFVD